MDFSKVNSQIDDMTRLKDGWCKDCLAPSIKALMQAEDFIQSTFFYERVLPERWLSKVNVLPILDETREVEVFIPLYGDCIVSLTMGEEESIVIVSIPIDANFRNDRIYEFSIKNNWLDSEAIKSFWATIQENIFELNPSVGLKIWDPEDRS